MDEGLSEGLWLQWEVQNKFKFYACVTMPQVWFFILTASFYLFSKAHLNRERRITTFFFLGFL